MGSDVTRPRLVASFVPSIGALLVHNGPKTFSWKVEGFPLSDPKISNHTPFQRHDFIVELHEQVALGLM